MKRLVETPIPRESHKPLVLSSATTRPLMDQVRSPVIVLEQKIVRYANPIFCEMFQVAQRDLIARSFDEMLGEDDLDRLGGWLTGHCTEDEASAPLLVDLQITIPGGITRWTTAKFFRAEWDGRLSVVGFLNNIEQMKQSKQAEERNTQSQKMEAVGRLAGGMAHDMNNVLGVIMGFASVMQTEVEPGTRPVSDIEHILDACKKGRSLMQNLLGFARRGKHRLEIFTLNKSVEEVVDLLKHTIPKKIRIKSELAEESVKVHGDSSQIHHAVMNVCLNAVDSMGDSGELTITADSLAVGKEERETYPELKKGVYARLRVKDTGAGMNKEVLDKAFEPFFTTKPLGSGSGLGLPMVYGTIKNHGGTVILHSAENKGTELTLLLPSTKMGSGSFQTVTERRTPSDLSVATILLIDDESLIRKASKRLLEKLGYRVLLAEDGREALRCFVENKDRIAIIMLDLMMPVMDGGETLLKLREIDQDVPILLASGYSKEEKAEELMARGADGFIQKPFDLPTLKSTLASVLE